ncbi:MAG: hypothetical protein WCO68_08565 [Verrucomicrobiota bacterium]
MNDAAPSPERPAQPEWWDKVGPEDFDGHSAFQSLTPEQKLLWLSQIQRFIATAKGKASERACRTFTAR